MSTSNVCPNKANHCSAFPGYGRKKCPYCGKYYINTLDGIPHKVGNVGNLLVNVGNCK